MSLGIAQQILNSLCTPSSILLAVTCLVTYVYTTASWHKSPGKQPPSLGGWMMANTYQYMTDMQGFLQRVAAAHHKSSIVQFRLGPKKIYMVAGEHNIQKINTPSPVISPDVFFIEVMRNVWGSRRSELDKFTNDKSGRRKNPIPGHEVAPGQPRLWHGQHHVYSEYLQRTEYSNQLTDKYYGLFSERLEKQPLREWREVGLIDFFEHDMAEAALVALMGPRIVELNPDFWPAMWEFARLAPQLMWGLPQWMNPQPWKIRMKFHNMCRKYVDNAAQEFDWNGSDTEAGWEPIYGSRMARELIRWATEHLSAETTAGMCATFIFGTNANSVPMSIWAMMELIADPELFRIVRQECLEASSVDPETGHRVFDHKKLFSMPFLQSVYIETLRLHVSINVTREVTQEITLDGYTLMPGALIQAPSQIGALEEAVWGKQGHPATEFWAGRNLKHNNGMREFTMDGKTSAFFPFGGGPSICPGRVFAKQEILMTIAALVTRFEIEMVDWTYPDGRKSDRSARNDQSFIGAVGIPPDRDMKIRWKRLW